MSIYDVWYDLEKSIKVYTKRTFDNVPVAAGVYAWFYPLEVFTYDLEEFIKQIQLVLSYESSCSGPPRKVENFSFDWRDYWVELRESTDSEFVINQDIHNVWDALVRDEAGFKELRKTLLASSILMPPLYVGKASNLRVRCIQHCSGKDSGVFKSRFEEYAHSINLHIKHVEDLVFVCMLTPESKEDFGSGNYNSQSLVEEILKYVARPPYGMK